MKKIFSVLLALLLVASLSACKEDSDDLSDLDKYKQEEEIITNVTLESGEVFHFEAVDSETVTVTKYEGKDAPHAVTIPDTLNGKTVVAISDEAFRSLSNIKSVTIPATVTKIGDYAFQGCTNLETVVIPAGVTAIGMGAFHQCEKLTSVTFAENCQLKTISHSAFAKCSSLKELTIPGHIETIEDGAFLGCSGLTTLKINEGVATIGAQAFQNCTELKAVTLPASLTAIGQFNFTGAENLCAEDVAAPADSYAAQYIATLNLPARAAG